MITPIVRELKRVSPHGIRLIVPLTQPRGPRELAAARPSLRSVPVAGDREPGVSPGRR
jgi:hypothetical protein